MTHSDNSQNSENVEQKKFTFDDLMLKATIFVK